jgi:hypothetical protein
MAAERKGTWSCILTVVGYAQLEVSPNFSCADLDILGDESGFFPFRETSEQD